MAQKDDEKKAGDEQARDTKTSDEAVKDQEKVPTSPEERGETDPDAAGEKVGAVQDGDTETALDEDVEVTDEDFGWTGTVAERNADGVEYDVPYAYLTADHLPRTSDSDDATKDWTAQHAGGEREDEDGENLDPVALVEVQGTPGQTFRVRELPNREVVEAAGIDYNTFVAGLPVRPDVEGEAPRRGVPA